MTAINLPSLPGTDLDQRVRPASRVVPGHPVWLAGLLIALGAAVATAHGLYEVAVAAGIPRALAWLYPLITDGLALVAYATTTQLGQHGRKYAWTVVVVAAGVSGFTQAGYLAGGVTSAPALLRFALGAWPALAAAIVAHLLYLLRGASREAVRQHAAAVDAAARSADDLAEVQAHRDLAAQTRDAAAQLRQAAQVDADAAAALRRQAEADRAAANEADAAPLNNQKTVPVLQRKQWIRRQLKAGNPITGAIIDKRYGTQRARTGARLLSQVRAEMDKGR